MKHALVTGMVASLLFNKMFGVQLGHVHLGMMIFKWVNYSSKKAANYSKQANDFMLKLRKCGKIET